MQKITYFHSIHVTQNERGLATGTQWADPMNMPGEEVMEKRFTWKRIGHFKWVLVLLKESTIERDAFSYPINPYKHLKEYGRGDLGLFGPNHTTHSIITRDPDPGERKDVRYLLVMRRKDGLVALPGGFTEPCDHLRPEHLSGIDKLDGGVLYFLESRIVNHSFAGFVDDDRCGYKNAWIETSCFHGNLSYDESKCIHLASTDNSWEIHDLFWMKMTRENVSNMYSYHGKRVREVMIMNLWAYVPSNPQLPRFDVCNCISAMVMLLSIFGLWSMREKDDVHFELVYIK